MGGGGQDPSRKQRRERLGPRSEKRNRADGSSRPGGPRASFGGQPRGAMQRGLRGPRVQQVQGRVGGEQPGAKGGRISGHGARSGGAGARVELVGRVRAQWGAPRRFPTPFHRQSRPGSPSGPRLRRTSTPRLPKVSRPRGKLGCRGWSAALLFPPAAPAPRPVPSARTTSRAPLCPGRRLLPRGTAPAPGAPRKPYLARAEAASPLQPRRRVSPLARPEKMSPEAARSAPLGPHFRPEPPSSRRRARADTRREGPLWAAAREAEAGADGAT